MPNRPDEYWWIRTDEDMPLELACVSFEVDTPAKVQLIGDDSWGGTPVEDFQWTHTDEDGATTVHSRLELVDRILPADRAREAVAKLQVCLDTREDTAMWAAVEQALALLGHQAPRKTPRPGIDSPAEMFSFRSMAEAMETIMDELEREYMEASGGDARDALRRALADAMEEIADVSRDVSRGYVRASRPADLARKLGPERRAREAGAGRCA